MEQASYEVVMADSNGKSEDLSSDDFLNVTSFEDLSEEDRLLCTKYLEMFEEFLRAPDVGNRLIVTKLSRED